MAETVVQDVDRGRGYPAALAAALQARDFQGAGAAVLEGVHSDVDKLRTAFFSDQTGRCVVALTGQSVELEEE